MTAVLLWYVVMTLIGVAAVPLAASLFGALPGRGLLVARPLGLLIFGYLFWLGWSVGLLPNNAGGAWAALAGVALLGVGAWLITPASQRVRLVTDGPGALSRREWWALGVGELLFVLALAGWAFVRAHDPSADHTEQPMDLMFMSSLWASPTWPPQDAWLSGYPIAYYYFGYWLITAVGRLAGTPPEIAYNVGQAAWFGLLAGGSYGVAWMVLGLPRLGRRLHGAATTAGALLAALAVSAAGNVQWMLEWLHAQGVDVRRLAEWARVRNFPEGVAQNHLWYIGNDWWWWRTSRVLADSSVNGGHQEVISEFPAFSYVLGDNHPHMLGMPVAILVLALALAWFWRATRPAEVPPAEAPTTDETGTPPSADRPPAADWALPPVLTLVSAVALGSLLFVNTWDFPIYWGLMTLACYGGLRGSMGNRVRNAAIFAGVTLAGGVLLVLPYLITAQSQANGIAFNFFNPTRLPQFLWVALPGVLGVGALVVLAWRERAPGAGMLASMTAVTVLLPAATLAGLFALVQDTPEFAAANPLPEGAASLVAVALERWRGGVWTLLLTGTLLALLASLWLARGGSPTADEAFPDTTEAKRVPSVTPFVLLVAGAGMLLYWAPEILFLRDNFGWRMNTIFKFYYQAWLLLGIAGAWSVTHSLAALMPQPQTSSNPQPQASSNPQPQASSNPQPQASSNPQPQASSNPQPQALLRAGREPWAAILAVPAAVLVLAGAFFLPAGARAKTNGFDGPGTLDASAWLEGSGQREAAMWLREHSPRDAVIAEAAGDSYRSDLNRVSTLSGRPTLLGWRGHQSQWRGDAYGSMTAGREDALNLLYRTGRANELPALLATWGIDYVVVSPVEREIYGMTPLEEGRIASVMLQVFESGETRIYAAPSR